MRVIPRSTGWRLGHAFGYLLLCWAGTVAAVIPPHFPWLLTALCLGVFFFVKYIRQHTTLTGLEGTCPKCGAPQAITKPVRLGSPHRLHCPACHQQLLLIVEPAIASAPA